LRFRDPTTKTTDTWQRDIQIAKLDEERRLVFGWLSVAVDKDGNPVVDSQDDVIFPEDLEKAAYDHVLWSRKSDSMHDQRPIGRLVESIVFTAEKQAALGLVAKGAQTPLPVGWWVGYRVDDEAAWKRVKSGELRAFSIGGRGNRVEITDGA